MQSHEAQRLPDTPFHNSPWRLWGPYVSERSWATVREDYSPDGNAWDFLPHELARSKAYRWGEDGIAGICDRQQLLVFAPAFWNERDPILKERLFGLTPSQANHGEDVKEYYFYLDNTPTHSYMRYLYKYPQAEFPYAQLIAENARRQGHGFEYELLDTGVFDQDRYFDIVIEYAKAAPDDLCIRIEAFNRGPEAAPLHLLPHLWFRNTWAWGREPKPEPVLQPGPAGDGFVSVAAGAHSTDEAFTLDGIQHTLGPHMLYAASGATLLFTNNETHAERVFGPGSRSRSPFVKDAFHRHVIHGEACVNPALTGTRAALHYRFAAVPPGGSVVVRLRLRAVDETGAPPPEAAFAAARPLDDVDALVARRRAEADAFYAELHPPEATPDERHVQRQALAGLLWNKMTYLWDVSLWLDGDNPECPPPAARKTIRNGHWRHHAAYQVLSPCEKWEYPWFAAWDLAFTCPALALVDPAYAKEQLLRLLFENFQHADGQIPAYEWEFSDLNPPVQAWAVWRVYKADLQRGRKPDRYFLEACFHKLLINFAWWVNKVDRTGNNIFEGGFLGMDNISVVDRSLKFEDGAVLEQSDASGYMAMFCLHLMRISLELARDNPAYLGLAVKFLKHYIALARAMTHMGGRNYQLWDEGDGFFYDVVRYPDGRFRKFRLRSLVGLIPLFAVERVELAWLDEFPLFRRAMEFLITHRNHLTQDVIHQVEYDGHRSLALTVLSADQLVRLMERLWNEAEFLSAYGVRSLSKVHEAEPFEFQGTTVRYEAAESDAKLKGGNSNWRGPVWFPTTVLLIESLRKLGQTFGPDFRMRLPASHGQPIGFADMARELANRLLRIFTRDATGRRPVYGGTRTFQEDPHWRDHLLFYEYFHGDNGAGLGASHQTGWTGLVALLLDEYRRPPNGA